MGVYVGGRERAHGISCGRGRDERMELYVVAGEESYQPYVFGEKKDV